ncbi:hypothetical protein [Plantibacter sp. RU18]|uniref:hypothetical protein n=1 Tax=Plantibacter sp. RU18 TaxID=3158143 RepID=UPI003D36B864
MTTKRGRSTYRPSSQPVSWRERLGSRRRVFIIVGLVLFLVADVILVGLALTANGRSTGNETQRPLPTFGTSPSVTPTPSEEPVAAEAGDRFLVAGSTDVLWRATDGTCDAPAVVERSSDAGATWAALPTGSAIDLRVVHALAATGPEELQLVGATGADCVIGGFTSTDAGETWESAPELLSTVAYETAATPEATAAVTLGGAAVAAPCPAVDVLASNGARTVVACSAVLAEWDAAVGAWTALPFAGIHAADVQTDQILFAARGVTGCSGLGVLRISGAALSATSGAETIGCVADADIAATASLSSIDGTSWLWVGDAMLRSLDGGATWSAVAS